MTLSSHWPPPSFSNRAHTYIHTTYTLQKQMHPDMHVRVRLHTGLGCPWHILLTYLDIPVYLGGSTSWLEELMFTRLLYYGVNNPFIRATTLPFPSDLIVMMQDDGQMGGWMDGRTVFHRDDHLLLAFLADSSWFVCFLPVENFRSVKAAN